jgi:septal ring factor EnvC (AmiA/AmiB activator)
MKYLTFILLVLLYACTGSTAQSPSKDMQKEKEFEALLNKVTETQQASLEVQKQAEEKQTKIVEKTITQIVELKTEINELKEELNSITADTARKFKLLPISDN